MESPILGKFAPKKPKIWRIGQPPRSRFSYGTAHHKRHARDAPFMEYGAACGRRSACVRHSSHCDVLNNCLFFFRPDNSVSTTVLHCDTVARVDVVTGVYHTSHDAVYKFPFFSVRRVLITLCDRFVRSLTSPAGVWARHHYQQQPRQFVVRVLWLASHPSTWLAVTAHTSEYYNIHININSTLLISKHLHTKSSAIAEGPRDAMSVEILSTAGLLYDKSHFKRITVGECPWRLLKVIGIVAVQ